MIGALYRLRSSDNTIMAKPDEVNIIIPEPPKLSCISILGPPASGKGTIGNIISARYGMPVITPGNIYKVLREEDSNLGALVRDALKDGGYCPDWLTNKIVSEEIQKRGDSILDGYPRTMKQVTYLLTNYRVLAFLHTESPYEDLFEAAMNRRECMGCKRVYSTKDPFEHCCAGSRFGGSQRWDDTSEMFPKRFETYMKATKPLIEAVEDLHTYKKFRMLGNPDGVNDSNE